MSIWKKRKLPSRPITQQDDDKTKAGPPDFNSNNIISQTPAVPGKKIISGDNPTKIIPSSPADVVTVQGYDRKDIPLDLVQSLHSAAANIKPKSGSRDTSSIEDMNELLKELGFHCHRLLGNGGMGSVFLATDTKLQRKVAIKVLLPRLSGNYQFTQMFLKEAETVAKFGHQNIVQVYAIHVVQRIYFIVMEFVEGTTLREKIRKEHKVSESETLRIMDQVSRALSETHQRGIIHRDIKPQNILLTRDGQPKVADFGLAISIRDSEKEGSGAAGTPTYMAPEQARGETPTKTSDIYSLGVVMYMMLSGKIPYRANSVEDVLKEISAGNKIDITKFSPNLPKALIKIVRKAMEARPSARYPDMKAFNEAVRNAWLSYQKRGLKPMIPRVKRAAWMYIAPPACLIAGILMGYLVHNPLAEKTSETFAKNFKPRINYLQKRLLNVMDNDKALSVGCSLKLQMLNDTFKRKDSILMIKYISETEFYLDCYETKQMLLLLNSTGKLTGESRREASAIWEAAEKKDKKAFYTHRINLFKTLPPLPPKKK
jgi:serine/threonine protein kinase